MRGGAAYRRTRRVSARGNNKIAAPTAMHHGMKNTTRVAVARAGGVHGEPVGGWRADWAVPAGRAGVAGAEGSVSCVLRRTSDERTS